MLWKGFQRPKRLEFERETLTDRFGRFYAQPFERGFGTTIGNALRRVLLSSIEGAAITAVKIDGVLHEFSPIPGVVEDATDIILNLKQIPLKLHVDHTKTLTLRVDKPGEVRARDIQADADSEILEPDAHIATIAEHGKLHMEMRMKRGRGYVSADKNFDEDLGIGWIPIDSVHSPVKKVNYLVEAARLGQTTDYDRLAVDVWTNGSINPRDAVSLASRLVRDHLNIFINLEEGVEQQVEAMTDQPRAGASNENLDKSVEELELSVRSYNCLKNANIRTIRELVQKTEAEMLKTKNFRRKSLNEIKEILTTTVPKAKELRPFVERLITVAKRGLAGGDAKGHTLNARRLVMQDLQDREIVTKLFDSIAPRFAARPGGYTRLLRVGFRRGDSAEVAQVELVGSEFDPKAKAATDGSPEEKPKAKVVGGRLRAAAERLRGKKDDSEPGGAGKKATKPAKGTSRRSTTPRKAG